MTAATTARREALVTLADRHAREFLELLNRNRANAGLTPLDQVGPQRRTVAVSERRVRARALVVGLMGQARILPVVGERQRLRSDDRDDVLLAVLENRLVQHVLVTDTTDCWRWRSTHDGYGYGTITVRGARWKAHRVAYAVWVADIPETMTIDHVAARGCRFKDCCNPAHLEVVTRGENALRAVHREDCTCLRCRLR